MGYTRSPLRYPGGKSRLAPFIRSLIRANGLLGAPYVEPFAGAAGVAWTLLFEGSASHIYLNDVDPSIYAFWRCVLNHTEEMCALISKTRVSMAAWKRARAVIAAPNGHSTLDLGFAAFFLNRTNRSGVIRGGVIGGKDQAGEWALNARYNKTDLLKRIHRIAEHGGKISLHNLDGARFISTVLPRLPPRALVYVDPPYMHRGKDLYWNEYQPKDHVRLAMQVMTEIKQSWIVSYDDNPATRRLYPNHRRRFYRLSYSAANREPGSEIMVFSQDLRLPRSLLPM